MKKLLGIIAVVVVIIVGAWYVLFGQTKPPQERLKIAFGGLLASPRGHLQATVDIKPAVSPAATLQEIKVVTDGDYQKGKDGAFEIATAVDAEGKGPGTTLSGKGELRLVGGKLFYKLDELPPVIPGATEIVGKWLPGSQNVNVLPDNLRQGIVKSFAEQQLFTDVKIVGGEKVNKYNTTHLHAKISPSGYASFMGEVTKALGAAPISAADLQKVGESFGTVPFDVWVDSGNNLRKVSVAYTNQQTKAVTTVEALFSPFVGSLKIEAPQIAAVQSEAPVAPTPAASSLPIIPILPTAPAATK